LIPNSSLTYLICKLDAPRSPWLFGGLAAGSLVWPVAFHPMKRLFLLLLVLSFAACERHPASQYVAEGGSTEHADSSNSTPAHSSAQATPTPSPKTFFPKGS
jgi:hypothetical protein